MSIKLLAGVAVIATGVGLSPLTPAAVLVHAAPSNPLTPCSDCLPGPGGGPGGHVIGAPRTPVPVPVMGGGPKTGRPSIERHGTHNNPVGH
jgi:hypothetical protein